MAGTPNQPTQRVERLAWLLDDAVQLPGGYRIGLDGIIGLIPGAGDAVGTLLSLYILFTAHRLGAPLPTLTRMLGNVIIDSTLGSIPVAGDLFDFYFKANSRNVQLLQSHLNAHPQAAM